MELSPHPAHDAIEDALGEVEALGDGASLDLQAAVLVTHLESRGYRISDGPPQPAWDILKGIARGGGRPSMSAGSTAMLDALNAAIREGLIGKGIDPGNPLVLCTLVHGAVTATLIGREYGDPELGLNAVKSYAVERVISQWM